MDMVLHSSDREKIKFGVSKYYHLFWKYNTLSKDAISQYYCSFDQINAVLVNIRDFSFSMFFKIIKYRPQTFKPNLKLAKN